MKQFTERQREIIRAAIELIAKKGIQELTIKNLSKSVGISEPAIYRHFESKMDIILNVLSHFKSNMESNLEKMNVSDKNALDALDAYFTDHFREFSKNPVMSAIIFSEEIFQNDKRLSEKVYSIMELVRENFNLIIERGQKNKEIRDDISKEQLALIGMGTLRIIIKRWRLSNYSFDLHSEGLKLWNALKYLILNKS